MASQRKILIAGISSDIGFALAEHWSSHGHHVVGTFRNKSSKLDALSPKLRGLYHCDFKVKKSITDCLKNLRKEAHGWDALVVCPATMLPIAPFEKTDIDTWMESFSINFLSIVQLLHGALQFRSSSIKPVVINFAGGGSNNAPHNLSAYVSSKIALVKLTELLAAENPEVNFSIVGPGWIKTKIHNEMLFAPFANDDQLLETRRRLDENDFVPIERVLFCCDWLLNSGSEVSGRNFSAANDLIGDSQLIDLLRSNENFYKLRRYGNDELLGVG